MTLRVHFHTFIPINHLDLPIHGSAFYKSTDVPVHHYTCPVHFLFFGITCTMTFQHIYWGTYPQIHPKINLPFYLHASLSSNHKDLPVTKTTCAYVHTCTHSWHYLFILSFWLTAEIYPSMFLLVYMSATGVPVHHYTCSVCFFFFWHKWHAQWPFIYWGTYPQIHPKINLPVYLHASLCLTTKTYLSPQLLVYMSIIIIIIHKFSIALFPAIPHTWTRSWHYLFMFIFVPINHWDLPVNISTAVHVHRCTCPTLSDHLWSIQLTTEIYPSMCLLLYMYTNAPVHQYTCSVISSFSA